MQVIDFEKGGYWHDVMPATVNELRAFMIKRVNLSLKVIL